MTREETIINLSQAAGVVKLVMGSANNCAFLMLYNGHDAARKLPNYRFAVKHAFKDAIEEFRRYELGLLHARENRLFHVADMGAMTRKKYGDIDDQQYYEFWQGLGADCYQRCKPMLGSLRNKYRISLLRHGAKHPEIAADLLTTQAVLSLACQIHESCVSEQAKVFGIPESVMNKVFGQFSLKRVLQAWNKAVELSKAVPQFTLESYEERNIEQGIEQLTEKISDPEGFFDSAQTAIEDFAEVFRTNGEMKKALREIGEIRSQLYK